MSSHDDPPPDGTLGQFVLGAALTIAVAAIGLDVAWFRTMKRVTITLGSVMTVFAVIAGALIPLLLVALWGYASKTTWGVFLKSGIAGLAGGIGVLVLLWITTPHPQGDDVLPLFFVIVGPMLVMGYAGAGVCIAGGGYLAFWLRQRRRIAWLERVMQGKNARYRIGPLAPENADAPLFLRFREGTRALWRVNPHPSYREHADEALVARVPRYV